MHRPLQVLISRNFRRISRLYSSVEAKTGKIHGGIIGSAFAVLFAALLGVLQGPMAICLAAVVGCGWTFTWLNTTEFIRGRPPGWRFFGSAILPLGGWIILAYLALISLPTPKEIATEIALLLTKSQTKSGHPIRGKDAVTQWSETESTRGAAGPRTLSDKEVIALIRILDDDYKTSHSGQHAPSSWINLQLEKLGIGDEVDVTWERVSSEFRLNDAKRVKIKNSKIRMDKVSVDHSEDVEFDNSEITKPQR